MRHIAPESAGNSTVAVTTNHMTFFDHTGEHLHISNFGKQTLLIGNLISLFRWPLVHVPIDKKGSGPKVYGTGFHTILLSVSHLSPDYSAVC